MIICNPSKSIQCPTSEAVSRLRLNHGTVDSHGPAGTPQSLATTANEDDLRYYGTDRPASIIDWKPTPLSSPAPPPTYQELCLSLASRRLQSVHTENLTLLQEFDCKYLCQASLFAAEPTPLSSPAPHQRRTPHKGAPPPTYLSPPKVGLASRLDLYSTPTPISSPAPSLPNRPEDPPASLASQLQAAHAENLTLLQEFDCKYLGQASLFAAEPTPISSPAPSLPNRPEDPPASLASQLQAAHAENAALLWAFDQKLEDAAAAAPLPPPGGTPAAAPVDSVPLSSPAPHQSKLHKGAPTPTYHSANSQKSSEEFQA